jgi:hypothetical protein
MALMKTHGSKAIVALIAIGVSTALVACGGSKASGEDAQAKAEDAALDYAKCMREHGVDVPDPQFGEDGSVQMRIGGRGLDESKVEAAAEACRKTMPEIGESK